MKVLRSSFAHIALCGLFLGVAASPLSSCSKSNPAVNESDYIIENLDQDSSLLPSPTTETKPEKSVPVTLSFSTPEEAIEYMNGSENRERYNAGILPVMARDELSYCTKLLHSDHPYFFIVDKAQLEIVVFDRYGREQKRVGMACSKNYGTKHKRRDNRTPEGFFSVKGVYNSTEWLYTDDDGNTSEVKGQFGPRFIRLNIPVTSQIGIHGTSAPWSIGHRRSHGCIRVTNDHIMELIEYVDSGMPVIVSPGSRDMAVNQEEGYYVPAVSTRRDGSKASPKGYMDRSEKKPIDENGEASKDSTLSVSKDPETNGEAHVTAPKDTTPEPKRETEPETIQLY